MSKFGLVVKNFKNCKSGLDKWRKGHGMNVSKENVREFLMYAAKEGEIMRVYQKEAEKKIMFWI